MGSVTRRTFGAAAASTLALCAFPRRLRAESAKLKVGLLLPRSGLQALIGQSCQRGADVAPELLRQRLGVDVELMNADTESNVDTARSRAERLIEQGAQVLVGAFDSGHTAAIAQVAEQRGVPHIVNIAAAPQITEQGYKFVFRNFPPAPEIGRNGLVLLGDIFRRGQGRAEDGRLHARQRHLRPGDGQRGGGAAAQAVAPVQAPRHHPVRSGGQGPDGGGVEGEGHQRRAPAAGLSPERRDRPATGDGQAAVEPDGRRQPRVAGALRGAVQQGAREVRGQLHQQHRLVQPQERRSPTTSRRRSRSGSPRTSSRFTASTRRTPSTPS